MKKNKNSDNNSKEIKVESPQTQLSATESKKIQNLTEIKNAIKEELKKHNIRIDDNTLNEYIRIKENAPWLTRTGRKSANGRRIDVFYKARNFKRICIGFEIKTGNEVDEKQLREEIEGLRSVEGCEESFLIVIAQEDPEYNICLLYTSPSPRDS